MLAGVGQRLFFQVLEGPKTYEVSAEAGSPAILRFQSSRGSHVCCNHCGKKHEWRSWLKFPLANNYDSSLQMMTKSCWERRTWDLKRKFTRDLTPRYKNFRSGGDFSCRQRRDTWS